MRLVPRSWHNETWVCSMRGHVMPACTVARLRPEDARLGVDLADGRRASRCLRCDSWSVGPPPSVAESSSETVPPLEELHLPRRGETLSDAILLRLIALNRAVHSLAFGLLAIFLLIVEVKLPGLKGSANSLQQDLARIVGDTGQNPSRAFLGRQLHNVLNLKEHLILVLLVTSAIYAVIEGVEAVGLWKEKRWAEYLTAVATAGFLPFEIDEILKRVTVLRVIGLIANLAVLAYLLWKKRLFGLNGGAAALEEEIDWDEALANHAPQRLGIPSSARRAHLGESKA